MRRSGDRSPVVRPGVSDRLDCEAGQSIVQRAYSICHLVWVVGTKEEHNNTTKCNDFGDRREASDYTIGVMGDYSLWLDPLRASPMPPSQRAQEDFLSGVKDLGMFLSEKLQYPVDS